MNIEREMKRTCKWLSNVYNWSLKQSNVCNGLKVLWIDHDEYNEHMCYSQYCFETIYKITESFETNIRK